MLLDTCVYQATFTWDKNKDVGKMKNEIIKIDKNEEKITFKF